MKPPLIIARDADGEWPDWAFEAGGIALKFVGGTDQWKRASYRMAYLRVVLDALEKGMPDAGGDLWEDPIRVHGLTADDLRLAKQYESVANRLK